MTFIIAMALKKIVFREDSIIAQTYLLLIFAVAAAVVGTVAVLYGNLFLELTQIAQERIHEAWLFVPYAGFIVTPVLFVVAAMLCRTIAPRAAGSGPEHVMAALQKLETDEGKKHGVHEYLSLRIAIIKIISSLIGIFAGGALGREGPVIQISASIFYVIGEKVRRFLPVMDIRTWVIAGSAGGFAAAFNTPLAGIVFAIEELAAIHFVQFKANVFWAVIIAGITSQLLTGSYILFEFPQVTPEWNIDLLVILLVAILCGIFAWLLKRMILLGSQWFSHLRGWVWYVVPVIAGLAVATVSYKVGTSTFGAGVINVQSVITSPTGVLSYQDVFGRYLNVCASALSGIAGGLLLPSLALGGGIGSLMSTFAPLSDARIFVTTGMAAFLAAMLHVPLTAAILVLEITNQRELILPLVLSAVVGSWVFQRLNDYFLPNPVNVTISPPPPERL
jgi:H+/Cl- antiporter ClcA